MRACHRNHRLAPTEAAHGTFARVTVSPAQRPEPDPAADGKRPPKVSVCIPTYNYADLIGQAVESILAQEFEDFELIVVDDASSDGTADVMRRYTDDPRVRFIQNEVNKGLFANFNYCAELAQGEYLKFLCADDWLDERFLADTVAPLERDESVGLVTTSHVQVAHDGRPVGIEYAPFKNPAQIGKREAIDFLIDWHYVIGRPTNVLMRKAAFDRVGGFDAEFAPTGDLHLWLRILEHYELAAVREPRCFVRMHLEKTHDFDHDPTEAVFRVWKDIASRPGTMVSAADLERAFSREASRCTVFMISALIGGRAAQARRIAAYTRPYVKLRRFVPRFLLQIPRIAAGVIARLIATRTGRYLVFDPGPSVGPPIAKDR